MITLSTITKLIATNGFVYRLDTTSRVEYFATNEAAKQSQHTGVITPVLARSL